MSFGVAQAQKQFPGSGRGRSIFEACRVYGSWDFHSEYAGASSGIIKITHVKGKESTSAEFLQK